MSTGQIEKFSREKHDQILYYRKVLEAFQKKLKDPRDREEDKQHVEKESMIKKIFLQR